MTWTGRWRGGLGHRLNRDRRRKEAGERASRIRQVKLPGRDPGPYRRRDRLTGSPRRMPDTRQGVGYSRGSPGDHQRDGEVGGFQMALRIPGVTGQHRPTPAALDLVEVSAGMVEAAGMVETGMVEAGGMVEAAGVDGTGGVIEAAGMVEAPAWMGR